MVEMFEGAKLLDRFDRLMMPEQRRELDADFVRYLMCDTFIMLSDDSSGEEPIDDHISDVADELSAHNLEDGWNSEPNNAGESNQNVVNSSESDSESDDDDDEVGFDCSPSFPQLQSWIRDSIGQLGGSVIVKIDNISPIDARWVLGNNSCCCTSVDDVIILLKTSDRIRSHLDITCPNAAFTPRYSNEQIGKGKQPETDESEHESACVNKTADVESDFTPPVLRIIKFDQQINQLFEFRAFVSPIKILGVVANMASIMKTWPADQIITTKQSAPFYRGKFSLKSVQILSEKIQNKAKLRRKYLQSTLV